MTLGPQILTLRKTAQLTQKQAATSAKVTEQTWRLWEQGKHDPSYLRLPGIARALGVPLGALFAGPDDPRVISEVVVSRETLLKIRRRGLREAQDTAERLADALIPILMAASRNRPVRAQDSRARPRRTRAEKLAHDNKQTARLAELNARPPKTQGEGASIKAEWESV